MKPQKKILLVENEAISRHSLELALFINGYNVTTASDGLEGLVWIRRALRLHGGFDLLIVDLIMPVMSGISLLNKLRQLKIVIPTLVITGCIDPEILAKLGKPGAVKMLKKPFEPDEFMVKVREVIANAEPPALPPLDKSR